MSGIEISCCKVKQSALNKEVKERKKRQKKIKFKEERKRIKVLKIEEFLFYFEKKLQEKKSQSEVF